MIREQNDDQSFQQQGENVPHFSSFVKAISCQWNWNASLANLLESSENSNHWLMSSLQND